jgi:hypothetical protein
LEVERGRDGESAGGVCRELDREGVADNSPRRDAIVEAFADQAQASGGPWSHQGQLSGSGSGGTGSTQTDSRSSNRAASLPSGWA